MNADDTLHVLRLVHELVDEITHARKQRVYKHGADTSLTKKLEKLEHAITEIRKNALCRIEHTLLDTLRTHARHATTTLDPTPLIPYIHILSHYLDDTVREHTN